MSLCPNILLNTLFSNSCIATLLRMIGVSELLAHLHCLNIDVILTTLTRVFSASCKTRTELSSSVKFRSHQFLYKIEFKIKYISLLKI
jgi:hypothetical protein